MSTIASTLMPASRSPPQAFPPERQARIQHNGDRHGRSHALHMVGDRSARGSEHQFLYRRDLRDAHRLRNFFGYRDSHRFRTNTQTAQQNYNLTINPLLTITTASLPAGTIQHAYSTTVAASGGVTPSWSAPGLPTGLSINSTTGVISGTPTSQDVSGYGDSHDSGGVNNTANGAKNYNLTIDWLLTITTASLPPGTITHAYSYNCCRHRRRDALHVVGYRFTYRPEYQFLYGHDLGNAHRFRKFSGCGDCYRFRRGEQHSNGAGEFQPDNHAVANHHHRHASSGHDSAGL